MSDTQVESVLLSEDNFEWAESAEGVLKFAEDLLDHVRHRINGWPAYMYDVCCGDETIVDDCAALRWQCVEALNKIAGIYKEVNGVTRAPNNELVESVACAILEVLSKCRDFISDALTFHFGTVHVCEFSPLDSVTESACNELGHLTMMINGLESIRSLVRSSNAA